MREQLKWYDEKADNSPWLDALAELRQRATREGHCFSTSRRSPLRSISTQRKRWATATTFSTSPMASGSAYETSAHPRFITSRGRAVIDAARWLADLSRLVVML